MANKCLLNLESCVFNLKIIILLIVYYFPSLLTCSHIIQIHTCTISFVTDRLSDFTIGVGNIFDGTNFNVDDSTVCTRHCASLGYGQFKYYKCTSGSITGRYVSIFIDVGESRTMAFCDVQVFGYKESPGKYKNFWSNNNDNDNK